MEAQKPKAYTVHFFTVYDRKLKAWKNSPEFASVAQMLQYINTQMLPYLQSNPTTTLQLQTRVYYR